MTGGQMIAEVTLTHATFKLAPRRFEAGTPPIAAAVGLGAALHWMQSLDWPRIQAHEQNLTLRLLHGLALMPGVRVLGPVTTQERRGVVSFAVEDVPAEDVCRQRDTHGVALRGGHHCAQPLMRAFGAAGAARASIAPYNEDADIDILLVRLDELIVNRRRH
jgi:cysteine desulfurase/selenocysteine lyase